MPTSDETTSFRPMNGPDVEEATLIDGLPGYGMVACIAVRQIIEQLDLDQYGSIVSAEHFPVLSYENGRLRNPVRLYANPEPQIVTLQSDIAISLQAFAPLSRTVVDALESRIERAIFLVEIPASVPEDVGSISGAASTGELEQTLTDAGIPLEEEDGLIIGPTGAVANQFFQADIPTAVLFVGTATDLFTPDPDAARVLIEDALNPIVEFDIDTTELEEQSGMIQRELQDMAHQVKQVTGGGSTDDLSYLWMYQ